MSFVCSKCQVYEPPSKPTWAQEGGKDWWAGGYNSGKYGYDQTGAYSKSWKAYDSYYKHDQKDGKQSYYYKDYNTYKKYSDGCGCDTSGCSQCDYTPDYYYKQVWPLSTFKVKCDKDGSVYDVYRFSWNKKYMAPKPVNVLPITLTLTLDSNIQCDDVDPTQLKENINQTLNYLLQLTDGTVGYAMLDPASVKCRDGVNGANTTITADIALGANPGFDVTDIIEILQSKGIGSDTDVCSVLPAGECPPPVQSAVMEWRFPNWDRLQAMLVDHQFRQSLQRYVAIVGKRQALE